ncbi:hypothetical protein Tco_1580802, partial [Tanacetum coccineum]
ALFLSTEDLVNVDLDDGVDVVYSSEMSTDVTRAMTVTVAVIIAPLHTIYPPLAGVALSTEAKAPRNPIWVEGKRAGCMPARRPGDAYVLPFLAKGLGGAKGGDLDKD